MNIEQVILEVGEDQVSLFSAHEIYWSPDEDARNIKENTTTAALNRRDM